MGILDYTPTYPKMKSLWAAYTKIIFSWNTVQPTAETTAEQYNYRDNVVSSVRENGLGIVGIIQSC